MAITVEHTKENLCAAHIYALAAMAGTGLTSPEVHDYGVDGTFQDVLIRGKRRFSSGFPLQYQAKASVNWELKDDNIVYDLESKSFNDIVTRGPAQTTMILILLCLPRDQPDWHLVTDKNTILRNCCYWGIPTGNAVPNEKSKKRIWLPTKQLLTPQSLRELLEAERARRELQAS